MCGKTIFIVSLALLLGLATGAARADMMAWYQFEGNANDSAGGNHGSLMGDAAFAPGLTPLGQALSLDGDGDYVSLPTPFVSVTGSPTKSIMAWVKPDSAYNYGRVLTLYRRPDGSSAFAILDTNSNPSEWGGLYMTGPSTYAWINSGVFLAANDWTHLALVQDNNNIFVYVNGALVKSAGNAGVPYISNPLNAVIGAYLSPSINGGYFDGLIDDVRIYDNALSQNDIRAVMPEPAALLLFGLGAVTLRRKR